MENFNFIQALPLPPAHPPHHYEQPASPMTLLPLVSIMIICEDQRAAYGLLGQGSTANRTTKHPKTHLYFLQMWPPCLIKNSIPCVLRNESMTQFNRCTSQFCREFWHQQHGSSSKYIRGKYTISTYLELWN